MRDSRVARASSANDVSTLAGLVAGLVEAVSMALTVPTAAAAALIL
ncbi:hypothetical protein AB4Y72_14165 [Arthrobacter sp. YAF34]